MESRVITSLAELESIKDTWNTLVHSNPKTDLPFYSWEWFYYSYKYYNEKATLSVIIVEEQGKIFGILPLIHCITKKYGVVFSELCFCNSSNTPRHTVIVSNEACENVVLDNIISYLILNHNNWHTIRFCNICETDFFHNYLLNSKFNYGMIQTIGRLSPVVKIDGEGTYEDYLLRHVSKDTRRRFKRNIAKLNSYDKTWDLKFYTSELELKEGLSAVYSVRKNSWKGDYKSTCYPKFISEVSEVLCRVGAIFIAVFFIGTRPVAAEFILRKDKRYYAITNDYDMNYRELAPGVCLLHYLIVKGFDEAWESFDFTGEAYDYKKSICNEYIKHSSFELFHGGFKSRMIFHGKTIILPILRRFLKMDVKDDVVSIRS